VRRKAAAQRPPQLQTETQMMAVAQEEMVPVPPTQTPLAAPMAPLGVPLSPSSPAGNLRKQLRCFRIHSKSTCEPQAMHRTGSSSSLADTYEALGAVEFHRLDADGQTAPAYEVPLTPGKLRTWAAQQPVTFMGMPEPTLSAMSMDLGEDGTRKHTGPDSSRKGGVQSSRLSSSVGPLAPVRPPWHGHTKQTPTWMTAGLGASSPLPQPPLPKTGSATRQPFVNQAFRASSMGAFRRSSRNKVNPGLQLPALQHRPDRVDQWLTDERSMVERSLRCM